MASGTAAVSAAVSRHLLNYMALRFPWWTAWMVTMSIQIAIYRTWLVKIPSAKCQQSQTSLLHVVGGRHSPACGMVLHDECFDQNMLHVYHDPQCKILEMPWKGIYHIYSLVSSILFSTILSLAPSPKAFGCSSQSTSQFPLEFRMKYALKPLIAGVEWADQTFALVSPVPIDQRTYSCSPLHPTHFQQSNIWVGSYWFLASKSLG